MGIAINKGRLGLNVAERRCREGLTQSDLAADAGLSVRTVVNVERGHRMPDLPTMLSLARALSSTIDALLLGATE